MSNPEHEVEQLAFANRHMAEGEGRLGAQEALVAQPADKGAPAHLAEDLLRTMEVSQAQTLRHRAFIAEMTARLTGHA
ncbi:hypothetical protein M446_1187 [Methylobacterium sp. 4-46]|uniref:hypothetical protein n=1 Tax=unclassified Methylobacterium TaxID=2615210 RepID=UPI000165C8DD|nr:MULTISPECIES: hypothetical protein [Methylobacterium]ACA15712.1 hypothetical protein M446_1187 [Methylobacterium sp. 4-46]WFT81447.1 hypothetical protein QA634_06040 [Methylobacterium nodulans]